MQVINGDGRQASAGPLPPTDRLPRITTAFRNCAVSVPRPTGDLNGFEVDGIGACQNGGTFAADMDSGTGPAISCSVNVPGKDRHIYRNYGFTLPADAIIHGIEVRLDAWADSTAGTPHMCVELFSQVNAPTIPRVTTTLGTGEGSFFVGGPGDTWGRTWTAAEINALFGLRITNVSSDNSRDFFLDWATIRVTYTDPP
jgi:hypothetical protein